MLHPYPEMNNYPIHAFDHIENTSAPTPDAGFLKEITYRGLRGEYPVAGDPKLRQSDCDCILGMRLQVKEEKPVVLDKKELYPSDKIVFGSFLGDLLNTYMTYSEEGQIRSKSDEERTVEFYATVYKKGNSNFKKLQHELKLDLDADEYSLSVMDFSSPSVNRTSRRNKSALALEKEKLMVEAEKRMKEFIG